MKRRTIKKILRDKLDSWLETLPEDVRAESKDHMIVTGGSIASMLLGEPIKDYDLYCDNITVAELLARHYVNKFNWQRKEKGVVVDTVPFVRLYDPSMRWNTFDSLTPFQRSSCDTHVGIFIQSAGIASESGDSGYQYFENEGADAEGAQEYVLKKTEALKSGGEPQSVAQDYHPVFLSQNAITLSGQMQIVIRFHGPADEIHKNYDYVHATNWYHSGTGELCLNPLALESLLAKNLVYQGSLYPICSLFRMRKFMSRGWRISAGEITKMALQISRLDLTDSRTLREQLIGVDAAYFFELIGMLKDWEEQNEGKPLETSYIIQIIDEISDKI